MRLASCFVLGTTMLFCLTCGGAAIAAETASAPQDRSQPSRDARPADTIASVLLVDNGPATADTLYQNVMNSLFNEGGWSLYDIDASGLPDPVELFLGTLRQHKAVIWYAGFADSYYLEQASEVLREYIEPSHPGEIPGRFMLLGLAAVGPYSSLPSSFIQDVLGISPVGAPPAPFYIESGLMAFNWEDWLPDLFSASSYARGIGMQPLVDTGILYQMEYCRPCYGGRPPFDPVVCVRRPERQVSPLARVITMTLSLEHFERDQAEAALTALIQDELGIRPHDRMVTDGGLVNLTVTNQGYVGSFFSSSDQPSCEYPTHSHVEHLFHAGLWVGARQPDGSVHVSCAAEDQVNSATAAERREFTNVLEPVKIWSSDPSSPNYHPDALATHHIECRFHDYVQLEAGDHVPLGIEVRLRALSWDRPRVDDFVILDYTIINISGATLRDVYVGFWEDTTVGNTDITDPYDPMAPLHWNYYDDCNGAWRPGMIVEDPNIWMMWERDDDGDDGHATSWVGTRLLGTVPAVAPPAKAPAVSYNAWRFRKVPLEDDVYVDDLGDEQPGRYQCMGNGEFDVGITPELDYSIASDWNAMLSTGPFPELAAGDSLQVTFAMVCGPDSASLLYNSRQAQDVYAHDFTVVAAFLTSLTAERDGQAAVIHWAVSSCDDRTAFRVWRQGRDEPRYLITPTPLSGRSEFQCRDEIAPAGPTVYWLEMIAQDGGNVWLSSTTLAAAGSAPPRAKLVSISPNPFNPTTRLAYRLARSERIELVIHDLRGHRIKTLLDTMIPAGEHTATWNGRDDRGREVPSGVYIVRLKTAATVESRKLVLAR